MNQEIVFVTGKGGVGKTTFASAFALKKARQGKRVLLVELGDQSFFRELFDLPKVEFEPLKLKENLWVSIWSGTDCLRNYAKFLLRVESLVRVFFENSTMRSLINIAPGLRELSILGQITSGHRHHGPVLPFDCFVIDGFSTGHFLSLLRAPKALAEAVQFGPMHDQSQSIHKVIVDAQICKYFIVTIPEELAFQEGIELADSLKKDFGIQPYMVLNRIVSNNYEHFSLDEEYVSDSGAIAQFKDYLKATKTREQVFIDKVNRFSYPKILLPMCFLTNKWELIESLTGKLQKSCGDV